MTLPLEVIEEIQKVSENLNFGKIDLEISFHDNHPKFKIVVTHNIIPNVKTSGEMIRSSDEK